MLETDRRVDVVDKGEEGERGRKFWLVKVEGGDIKISTVLSRLRQDNGDGGDGGDAAADDDDDDGVDANEEMHPFFLLFFFFLLFLLAGLQYMLMAPGMFSSKAVMPAVVALGD